jgi:hypothetical protein
MGSQLDIACLDGPTLTELRRALRRGTAEVVLSSGLTNALRKLHDSLLRVQSLGGNYEKIAISPELAELLGRVGIARDPLSPITEGVAGRRSSRTMSVLPQH